MYIHDMIHICNLSWCIRIWHRFKYACRCKIRFRYRPQKLPPASISIHSIAGCATRRVCRHLSTSSRLICPESAANIPQSWRKFTAAGTRVTGTRHHTGIHGFKLFARNYRWSGQCVILMYPGYSWYWLVGHTFDMILWLGSIFCYYMLQLL